MATLLQAAEAGDLAHVQTLYTTKVIPSQQPEILASIAAIAAQHGQPDILEWCFQQGLVLPTCTPAEPAINNEIFKRAIWGGHIAIYDVLLKHGLDLNAQYNEAAGDALTSAASAGNPELVRWLLEHGHKPDSRVSRDEYSAILQALDGREPNMEVLKLLVEHGADVNGSGAVVAAAELGNLEALQLFVESGKADLERSVLWYGVTDKESIDAEGSPLFRACYKGQDRTVQYLLSKGARTDTKDKRGRTCMEVAREKGYKQVVELLEART